VLHYVGSSKDSKGEKIRTICCLLYGGSIYKISYHKLRKNLG